MEIKDTPLFKYYRDVCMTNDVCKTFNSNTRRDIENDQNEEFNSQVIGINYQDDYKKDINVLNTDIDQANSDINTCELSVRKGDVKLYSDDEYNKNIDSFNESVQKYNELIEKFNDKITQGRLSTHKSEKYIKTKSPLYIRKYNSKVDRANAKAIVPIYAKKKYQKAAIHKSSFSLSWFFENVQPQTAKDENKDQKTITTKNNDNVNNYSGLYDWNKPNPLISYFFGQTDTINRSQELSQGFISTLLKKVDESAFNNDRQKAAINMAVNEPICVIQGPPGTGKTHTITDLISIIRNIMPDSTIAVICSNYGALSAIKKLISARAKEPDIQSGVINFNEIEANDVVSLGHQGVRRELCDPDKCVNSSINSALLEENNSAYQFSFDKFTKKYHVIFCTINSIRTSFTESPMFDYVIVDECSQVDMLRGLIAMSCARHLVLVGDDCQLPPVYVEENYEYLDSNNNTININDLYDYRNIPQDYLIKENQSFLSTCESIFKLNRRNGNLIMLKEHYRCHPRIINFCNDYMYNHELKIIPDNAPDYMRKFLHTKNEIPVRIRLYNGKFNESELSKYRQEEVRDSESIPDYLKSAINNRDAELDRHSVNMKQVMVFIMDELDMLKDRLGDQDTGSIKSACIISPSNRQLLAVQKMIISCRPDFIKFLDENDYQFDIDNKKKKENNKKSSDKPDPEDFSGSNISILTIEKKNNTYEKVGSKTIHKVQGREFDIVYVMPVRDNDYFKALESELAILQDNGEKVKKPTSQEKADYRLMQRRMLNVAISRAVQEVVVIASSNCDRKLNDDEYAPLCIDKYINYIREEALTAGFAPDCGIINIDSDDSVSKAISAYDRPYCDEVEKGKNNDDDNIFEFITEKCMYDNALEPIANKYGLHLCCNQARPGKTDEDRNNTFIENIFAKELESLFSSDLNAKKRFYDYVHGTLSNVNKNTGEAGNNQNPPSFDFILCKRNSDGHDKMILAIEVDGPSHRKYIKDMSRDKRKNELVMLLGGKVINISHEIQTELHNKYSDDPLSDDSSSDDQPSFYLLRFPTDGTTFNEKEWIEKYLHKIL